MALYHGSKDGIKGDIRPDQSRMETDFGQGFYMGENQEQPKTLIATHHRPVFYKLKVNLHDLKCVKVSGTTWAMLVAYNRGKLEDFQDTPLYQKISRLTANCDMVIGPIADDKIYNVLEYFYDNLITDRTLLDCMQAMQLGEQYVAKSNKACDKKHIQIMSEKELDQQERARLRQQAEDDRDARNKTADDRIKAANRLKYKVGRIFEEILEEGDDNALEILPNPNLSDAGPSF